MENLVLVDSENFSIKDVRKGDKLGGQERKKLLDISNFQERPKLTNVDVKKKSSTLSSQEYLEKLQKDNAELMKHLADRNKLVQLSVMELRKLRLNLEKVKLQNTQLAQANSHMLMELNTGKDRLRVLQHDLGCANGLLKARKLEAAERRKRVPAAPKANNEMGSSHCEELGKSSQADNEDRPTVGNQRKQSRKQSQGRVPVKTVHDNEEANKKRHCSRRQSARLKAKESEATEDSFEVDDAEFPVSSLHDASGQASIELFTEKEDEGNVETKCDLLNEIKEDHAPENTDKKRCSSRQSARVTEAKATEDSLDIDDAKFHASSQDDNVVGASGQAMLGLQIKEEDKENTSFNPDTLNSRRSSVGRPSRRATEKIQSYKERPLNVKMRRSK